MKLVRIVAERFGRLESVSLGDLGPGLTVVHGPNEAGKTSFTTLVRYVLYGYPTKRGAEPDYGSDSGKRLGRLVFSDAEGEWSVERTEGVHGGPVAVRAIEGAERPGLLEEVTRGIGRDAFRIVFGFGLEEMAQIEAGRGAGVDILSRLYAAQVGLEVSPSDVRSSLEARAGELWRPRASNPTLNALKTRIADTRREIAALEAQAARYAADQEYLADVALRLEAARSARDEAVARANELAAAAQRLADLEARLVEVRSVLGTSQSALRSAREKSGSLLPDERVLSVAAEVGALLEDLSAFRERLRRAEELAGQASAHEARSASALAAAGIDRTVAAGADLGPETQAGLERWRSRLAALESQVTTSRRAADTDRDALGRAGSGELTALPPTGRWLPGSVALALAVLVIVFGVLAADWVQVALGTSVGLLGAVLLARALKPAGAAGLDEGRRSEARRVAEASEAAAQRDADELERATAQWHEWLVARAIATAGDDPAAVTMLVTSLKEYRSAEAEARASREAAERELASCRAYRDSLAALVAGFAPELASAALDEVPAHAARIRGLIDSERGLAGERDALALEIERLELAVAEAGRREAELLSELAEIVGRFGLADADALRVEAEHASARTAAREATAAFDELATEHAALATRLDEEGRGAAMAELRLELAGLEERRESALEEYAVLAVAEALMAKTQAFHEQARQPEVVRRASELFSTITAGRYERVSVPSDGGEFVVFDAQSRPRPSSELSTGTAQQLYLALRIALIETLDAVGHGLPVLMDDVFANFDPERKQGAAQAVRELAAHRQVVLFTCHPETAELIARVAPDRTELRLDRCS